MSALNRIRKIYPEVESVVDASKDMDIVVEKRDTTSSIVRNHKECALAHAARRIEGVNGALINVTTAYIIKGDKAFRYKLPESVSLEIVSFDREAGFDIGEYHLHRPAPADKLHALRPGGHGKRTGKGKKIRQIHFTGNVRRKGDVEE